MKNPFKTQYRILTDRNSRFWILRKKWYQCDYHVLTEMGSYNNLLKIKEVIHELICGK